MAGFNELLEEHIRDGTVPTDYFGMLNPIDDDLWIVLHDWPFAEQDQSTAVITYPGSNFNILLSVAIVPVLTTRFDIGINRLPLCFERRKRFIRKYIDCHFTNCTITINSPVTVTCHLIPLCITFYPVTYDEYILI